MSVSHVPRSAAAYIRVSTDDQTELSPETQLAEIRKYAQREDLHLPDEQIYIDAGISGKKAERRPAFMRMIAAAKQVNPPFSVILLWKYSRFARNQEESIFYKSILRSKCNVEVISITEPLIDGPFGSLIERIIEWMDEFYSVRLSQEVKRSMTVNAQRGNLQSAPAFGYRVVDGHLAVREEEAQIVRRIFDRFNKGMGLFAIARELNDLGVHTHRGNPFENRTVEYILRNPVYIGKLRWNPAGRTRRNFSDENIIVADAEHVPLVSREVWENAQRRLDEIKTQRSCKARPASELKTWISGMVHCSHCGASLIFSGPCYYKCSNYARGRCAHSQHIRANLLEDAILARLSADAAAAGELEYEITCAGQSAGDTAWLESTLRQTENSLVRLRDAYLAGVLDLDGFADGKRCLDQREAVIRRELEEIRGSFDAGDILRASAASAIYTLRRKDASLELYHNAACAVIESCVFDKESATLSITYRASL